MRKPAMMVATAAVAALLAAGCTDQSTQTGGDGHIDHDHATSHSGSGASPGPAADADDTAAHNADDIMFAQHMIPHHSQAVEMADILLAKDDVDPRVVELAEQIRAAQAPEIEQMNGWLQAWGNPAMPAMDHGDMEGMVAPEDIEALRNAPGPEATKLFLNQMIAHHEGAITMAQDEIDTGEYGPAVEMSRAIIASQQQEIDTMKSILKSL
jgi:uncharacterized protein (DUF305 family)